MRIRRYENFCLAPLRARLSNAASSIYLPWPEVSAAQIGPKIGQNRAEGKGEKSAEARSAVDVALGAGRLDVLRHGFASELVDILDDLLVGHELAPVVPV